MSLSQALQGVGYCHAIGSLLYCLRLSRLASAEADFPFFERNCSAAVVPRLPFQANYDGYCNCVSPRNHFHPVQVQVSSPALHSVLSSWDVGDHGMLPETMD